MFTMKDVETDLRGHNTAESTRSKYSFTKRIGDTWNKLPMSAVNAPTITSFKSEVDAYLSTQVNMYSL